MFDTVSSTYFIREGIFVLSLFNHNIYYFTTFVFFELCDAAPVFKIPIDLENVHFMDV
jgi:hypothetical protein